MSDKKYYAIGTTTPEAWERVHEILTQDGTLEDNIPTRPVECTDLKEHSPTRAVYLLNDEEAAQLSQHPEVKFVCIEYSKYPEEFPPNPDEIHAGNRYSSNVKNYNYLAGATIPNPATIGELNRAGYQLLRSSQYDSPWYGTPEYDVKYSSIPKSGTGKDVDVIVGDDGCWFGHPEFQNNTGSGPVDYVGGNVLPGNGTCDVLDLVLDGPYYIDPAWFDASPGTRLMTRWDGTIVPTESAAKDWWGNASMRSSAFASAGTVTIPSVYTRADCNGTKSLRPTEGVHGTATCGLTFGRTFGWAYNANKWFVDAIGNYGVWPVDNYFDVMKIFHQVKPVNPTHGNKNPTLSSNSWGYRTTVSSIGYYYFRQGTSGSGGVAYSGTKPQFMYYLGSAGDGNRFKGEMLDNTLTVSGDELIASGVIFVVAAGNSNQQQVNSSHPNFNNYWSSSASTPLSSALHSEFGVTCYNTVNRRGFPQHLGKYTSSGTVVYPAINIGALDDNYHIGGKEQKVNYSDMGNEIDIFAPADGTLSSAHTPYGLAYTRYDQTPCGVTAYDTRFSGTSAACPVAAGLIATQLENNRTWTWQDVRTWLHSIPEQSATTFYQGTEPSTATDPSWSDLNSLLGASRRVIYNEVTDPLTATTLVSNISLVAYDAMTSTNPVVASGGTGNYSYSVSPTLPTGLTYTNTGTIYGTPTALSSTASYTVTVDDTVDTVHSEFNLNVYALPLTTTLSTSTVRIRPFLTTVPITPVTASGGNGTKTFSINPSGLPGTLTFNTTNGQIGSGIVNTIFTSTYTISVEDQLGQISSKQFILTSEPIPLYVSVAITNVTLYAYGDPASFTPVNATGGSGAITFSISPSLPNGVSFNTSTGEITGYATALSSSRVYTVTVQDQTEQTRSATFTMSVIPIPFEVTTSTRKVTFYSNQIVEPFSPLSVTGGSGPVVYSVTPALPEGINFNTSTGEISGNTGAYSRSRLYTIVAEDRVGQQSSLGVSFKIASTLNLIEASDEVAVYDALFSVMGTTATGYGATLIGDPIEPGTPVKADEWDQLKIDIERCLIHQNGTSTNNITVANTGSIVNFTTPARMYTTIQFLQKNVGQVHPSQLETFTYNTSRVSPVEWTNTNYVNTFTMLAGTGYMTTIDWSWFYENQIRYFFNLGGTLQPEVSIEGTPRAAELAAWQTLITEANGVVFGRNEFLQAMASPDKTYTYIVEGTGDWDPKKPKLARHSRQTLQTAPWVKHIKVYKKENKNTNLYSSNAVVVKFRIMKDNPSDTDYKKVVGSINFVAGLGYKKKGKKKKTGKQVQKVTKWNKFNKKNVVIGYNVYDIFSRQFIGKYIAVRLQLKTDFRTTYPNGANGGIAAQIPQSQIIANSLSASPSPIPQFSLGVGDTSSPQTITLRNNTTQTCIIDDIILSGYTTGTITPTSLSIPAYSSADVTLTYTGSHPGHHRGLVDILSPNTNRLTLFTEVNVGSTDPRTININTTTYDVISQDFLVDHAGGYFKDFDATFTPSTGYSYTEHVPGTIDKFNITFDPRYLTNGIYSTTAHITVNPMDSSQIPTVWNVPMTVNLNVQNRHIADWRSCKLGADTILGISYDIIDGRTYLTAGLCTGSPVMAELASRSTAFNSWNEVYRMPLEQSTRKVFSRDYLVKSGSFKYGDYFGVGAAAGSILTIRYDGALNVEVLMNTVALTPGQNTAETLDLSTAFRYYDSRRAQQLQSSLALVQGKQTYCFTGFDRSGQTELSLVLPN